MSRRPDELGDTLEASLDEPWPPDELDTGGIVVRSLTLDDLDAVVQIDEAATGLARREFYHKRIRRSLEDSSIHLSLGAEVDGQLVGFVAVTFYTGEFGMPEPVAVLDAIGVHPAYQRRRVGTALLRQLETNLRGLGVRTMRTEADWDRIELLTFLARHGFRPAARLCLDKPLR